MSKSEEAGNGRFELLSRENHSLRRAVEELSILNDIATAINSTLSIERIIDLIIQKSLKHIKVEQGVVLLLDEQREAQPFQTMIRGWDTNSDALPYRLDSQITGWMLKNKKPLLINDLSKDQRFPSLSQESIPIASLLAVPLLSKGRLIGLITVFNKKTAGGFSQDDLRLLAIIAAQSAQVIENARLLKEEQELLKMQEELRLAHTIQANLLPETQPEFEHYDIAGKSIPARKVGGDYYDFIPIDSDHLAICLGDVSGKGMPAALLMSNLQATVHSQNLPETSSAECLIRANHMLYNNTPPEKFATFFFAVLDSCNNTLTYANAGHNYPYLFSQKSQPSALEGSGIVLGCVDSYPYYQQEIQLSSGDLVLIYSDGITEACDAGGEEFGESQLIALVKGSTGIGAEELVDRIIDAACDYAEDPMQNDDMTVVVVRKL